jgi:hypothetical protein
MTVNRLTKFCQDNPTIAVFVILVTVGGVLALPGVAILAFLIRLSNAWMNGPYR